MTPRKSGLALAAEIHDARTIVLADCGHMMLVERPNETLDALRDIL
jgi:pimeloyl-ACP methyl ester carboxylesterase